MSGVDVGREPGGGFRKLWALAAVTRDTLAVERVAVFAVDGQRLVPLVGVARKPDLGL